MRHPLISLFVAIGLALFGGGLMVPVSAHKPLTGPDGQTVLAASGKPVMVADHWKEFRINAPAYFCFACAAMSLLWTVFLVVLGIAAYFGGKTSDGERLRGAELESYVLWRRKNRESHKAQQADGGNSR
jgi:hypothetical protein